jgi:FimV-like protein
VLEKLEKVRPGRGLPILARAYLKNGEFDKAVKLAEQVIASQPDQNYGYLLLCDIYLSNKQLDQAEKVLQEGIAARGPQQSIRLRMRLGRIYEFKGDDAAARKVYEALRKDFPESPRPLFALGTLADRLGDKRQALELYQEALRKDKNDTLSLNNLAYLYAENYSEKKKALELAIRAYRLAPTSPNIMDTLGFILWQNGRYQEARKLLEKAHLLMPGIPAVSYHLAQAYASSGETQKAVELLKEVVAFKGDFAQRQEARKLLARLEAQKSGVQKGKSQ